MSGLWTGNHTTEMAKTTSGLGVLGGQMLAIGVSAAVVAAQYLTRPVFDHSVYMLSAVGLLVCTVFGGPWSILTVSLLLTAAGFSFETLSGFPLIERLLRAGLFLGTGLAIAAWLRRVRVQRDAAT